MRRDEPDESDDSGEADDPCGHEGDQEDADQPLPLDVDPHCLGSLVPQAHDVELVGDVLEVEHPDHAEQHDDEGMLVLDAVQISHAPAEQVAEAVGIGEEPHHLDYGREQVVQRHSHEDHDQGGGPLEPAEEEDHQGGDACEQERVDYQSRIQELYAENNGERGSQAGSGRDAHGVRVREGVLQHALHGDSAYREPETA